MDAKISDETEGCARRRLYQGDRPISLVRRRTPSDPGRDDVGVTDEQGTAAADLLTRSIAVQCDMELPHSAAGQERRGSPEPQMN